MEAEIKDQIKRKSHKELKKVKSNIHSKFRKNHSDNRLKAQRRKIVNIERPNKHMPFAREAMYFTVHLLCSPIILLNKLDSYLDTKFKKGGNIRSKIRK